MLATLGTVSAQTERAVYVLQADGLACPFCAYGIEKQLGRIDGVATVSTDIESGTVTVTMSPGASLTEKQAKEAVDRAGFTLRGFKWKTD
ncbi:hypothetical protein TH25_17375 [Thalassospira profundimaris]|uniref:HMA domain-containing protein n=2 Tax=Thalassospira profundimaris TaxID=502049 RepID=A0A367WX23_9PROT|nr:hypothetical protein TH25_17375 [Thalassospira profundimaris]